MSNILKNPGFEEGTPKNWQTWVTGTIHKYTYPEIGRSGGGSSVAIEYKSRETGKMAAWIQGAQIDPTNRYKLSGYIRTDNIIGSGASIRADFKDKDGKFLSTAMIMARQKGTIPWTYFEGTMTPNVNATTATIILDLNDCSGKVWFDDISFSIEVSISHPNMYLNMNEINDITPKINSNTEPWKTAYQQLISNTNTALYVTPPSVTYKGKIPPSGDKHDYFTEHPYGGWKDCSCAQNNRRCSEINCCGSIVCDGKINLDHDRTDYNSAILLGKSVRDLGLAYVFTQDIRYARKALDFIDTWCINSNTKMNPKFTGLTSHVELCVTIPAMLYGADLIWNYSGWSDTQREIFKSWTTQILSSAYTWGCGNKDIDSCGCNTGSWSCNNPESWRLVFICSAGNLIEDQNSLNYAFNGWKKLIKYQMDIQGKMTKELSRTTSLSYSTFAINATTLVAEIAKHNGIDLYSYKFADERGLEKALDFHAPYIVDPSKWPYQQIKPYRGENAAIYELAYTFKQKKAYMDVVNKLGRPIYDIRVLGPVTLTHSLR